MFKLINYLTTPLEVARCKCICSLLSDGFVFAIFARKIPFWALLVYEVNIGGT